VLRSEARDDFLEGAAPLLKIFELIKTGARRRQKHRIAGNRFLERQSDGMVQRAGVFHLD
jgi:hypothetical protein